MRTFLGDYIFGGFGTTRREFVAERTTNTHVLGKGRPGEKVGVERTTRTEYVLKTNVGLSNGKFTFEPSGLVIYFLRDFQ